MQIGQILLWGFLIALVGAKDQEAPHLLVLKSVDKYDPVAGHNLTVSINIFNIGQSPAHDVEVDDSQGWPSEGVKEVEGPKTFKLEKLTSGSNQTYSYVVSPQHPGELRTGAAKILYRLEAKGEETKTVKSNTLPVLPVLTSAEYEKKNTKHLKEWFTFFMLSLIPVGLPGCMYMMATNKLAALDKSAVPKKR
eukprot:NODE_2145_length_757_cov_124.043785_g1728_i0.p1 GENE.NODE_2145_length_757_cov_124.043785_g1728_i0~~NODE_2145_length_757_cov_124.043785_g1728_i0.p1  ORF type:complete len:193 (+),score=42.62 NODE_2145_length_757_cov_124.043785_g1728_i0:70-648(+)